MKPIHREKLQTMHRDTNELLFRCTAAAQSLALSEDPDIEPRREKMADYVSAFSSISRLFILELRQY